MILVPFLNISSYFAENYDGIVWTNPAESTKRTGLLAYMEFYVRLRSFYARATEEHHIKCDMLLVIYFSLILASKIRMCFFFSITKCQREMKYLNEHLYRHAPSPLQTIRYSLIMHAVQCMLSFQNETDNFDFYTSESNGASLRSSALGNVTYGT